MTQPFAHLIGNEHIKSHLSHMLEKGSMGNSLLFAGMDGIGKSLFARILAEEIICQDDPDGSHRHKILHGNHPDIREFRPEGKTGMHSISTMRQFNEEVYQAPYEAKHKIFILQNADRMLPYSANALLKTFEEPAPSSIIILISSAPETFLPTILSRCRIVHFSPVNSDLIADLLQKQLGISKAEADRSAILSKGSISKAFALAKQHHDPKQASLFALLCKGRCLSFQELSQASAEISEHIEKSKKESEEVLRQEFMKSFSQTQISATQKESIEKEIEGAVSMRFFHDINNLLDDILSWYRDLHLIRINGRLDYIFNKFKLPEMQKAVQTGQDLPLEVVFKAAKEAKLSVERSTSLSVALEGLFLKLNFL